MPEYKQQFASWSEFVDHASATPFSERGSDRWAGGSWEQALVWARQGWPEGLTHIQEISAHLRDLISPRTPRPEIAFSPVGPGVLDMHRYIDGHPEPYMIYRDSSTEFDVRDRGILRVVAHIGVSGAIEPEVIRTRGAALFALIDALESQGHRCEVDIVCVLATAKQGGERIEVRVRVKDADQPLEPEMLAMALINPVTLRRLVFAWGLSVPVSFKKFLHIPPYGCEYGIPVDPTDRGDIYLPKAWSTERQWDSPESAASWVRDQLQAQGIEFEEE